MEKHQFELNQDDGNEFYQALSRLENAADGVRNFDQME